MKWNWIRMIIKNKHLGEQIVQSNMKEKKKGGFKIFGNLFLKVGHSVKKIFF